MGRWPYGGVFAVWKCNGTYLGRNLKHHPLNALQMVRSLDEAGLSKTVDILSLWVIMGGQLRVVRIVGELRCLVEKWVPTGSQKKHWSLF